MMKTKLFFCKLGLIVLGLMMPVFAGAAQRYRKNPTRENRERFKRAEALYQDSLKKK
jgi:hypothetical protein